MLIDAVEAAELQHRRAQRRPRSCRATSDPSPPPCTISVDDSARGLGLRLLGARDVRVGDDDVPAALGDLERDLAADAAAAADDDDDLPAELLLGRHPLQLGLLERPVLDAERLGPRQRDVVVERS